MNNERKAEREFAAWFVRNYPAGCTIHDPSWHAPKIMRASVRAVIANGDSPRDAVLLDIAAECETSNPCAWDMFTLDDIQCASRERLISLAAFIVNRVELLEALDRKAAR
jgi:hypothetical protein